MKYFLFPCICLLSSVMASAQTDVSLFWRKDSVQQKQIISTSEKGYEYKTVGHHGPAIENEYMALRLYFRDGGSIDVYNKQKAGLELAKYAWYPSDEEIAAGAGCDEYRVGKTVGLGGIALWDGEKEIKLNVTAGREARVEKTAKGAMIEMIHRGVEYKDEKVDIAVRVFMTNGSRTATIEAECISGQKVVFLTGVNYHEGQSLDYSNGRIAVWGIHPADVVKNPLPIGGGMKYSTKKWSTVTKTADMLQIVSKKPVKKATTTVVAACSRETSLNNEKSFFNFVKNL